MKFVVINIVCHSRNTRRISCITERTGSQRRSTLCRCRSGHTWWTIVEAMPSYNLLIFLGYYLCDAVFKLRIRRVLHTHTHSTQVKYWIHWLGVSKNSEESADTSYKVSFKLIKESYHTSVINLDIYSQAAQQFHKWHNPKFMLQHIICSANRVALPFASFKIMVLNESLTWTLKSGFKQVLRLTSDSILGFKQCIKARITHSYNKP